MFLIAFPQAFTLHVKDHNAECILEGVFGVPCVCLDLLRALSKPNGAGNALLDGSCGTSEVACGLWDAAAMNLPDIPSPVVAIFSR